MLCEIDIIFRCTLNEFYTPTSFFFACCAKSAYSLECCAKSMYIIPLLVSNLQIPFHVVISLHIYYSGCQNYSGSLSKLPVSYGFGGVIP